MQTRKTAAISSAIQPMSETAEKTSPNEFLEKRSTRYRAWAEMRRRRGPQSPDTIRRYEKAVAYLINRHGSLESAVDWLASADGDHLRKSYFSSLRSAVRFEALRSNNEAVLEKLHGLHLSKDRLKKAKDLAHRRAKVITVAEMDKLIDWLMDAATRSQKIAAANPNANPIWSYRTAYFLLASNATGLRPVEWQHAKLVREVDAGGMERVVLRVRNAKTLSPEPRYRDLVIDNDLMISAITSHLANISEALEAGVSYPTYYARCRNRLMWANRNCWPRRRSMISFYSARNNFHARLINVRMPLGLIAYLMGHAPSSADISGGSYGRSGRGGIAPTDTLGIAKGELPALVDLPALPDVLIDAQRDSEEAAAKSKVKLRARGRLNG